MADSIDNKHFTSAEYFDPYCDLCYETKGINVKVFGYCEDCFQFLCADCSVFHAKLQGTKTHNVLKDEMPKSQADKPPRYERCDHHPKQLRKQFCLQHKILLCPTCSSSEHSACTVRAVEDICKVIPNSEIDETYAAVKTIQGSLKSAFVVVDKNIQKLNKEKKQMLDEVTAMYLNISSNLDKLFQEIKNDIETKIQSCLSTLSEHQERISALRSKVDLSLNELSELKGKNIDTKVFLRVQENIGVINNCKHEIQDSYEKRRLFSSSFVPNKQMHDLCSSEYTLGSIELKESKAVPKPVPDILFPVSELSQPTTTSGQSGEQLSEIRKARGFKQVSRSKPTMQTGYNVKLGEDRYVCSITGIAFTYNGNVIFVDKENRKVKLFSKERKCLSTVSLKELEEHPYSVTMVDQQEAVVTCCYELVILSVSETQLAIKSINTLPFIANAISEYKGKLVITAVYDKPPSVKLIDKTGKVYWSVSTDQQGYELFSRNWYLSSHVGGSAVIVTNFDYGIVLLNGETGQIISTRKLTKKHPVGVTTDLAGNVYISYVNTGEVSVFRSDLKEEKIILTVKDGMGVCPHAIAHDSDAHRLLVSFNWNDYDHKRNQVLCYQL